MKKSFFPCFLAFSLLSLFLINCDQNFGQFTKQKTRNTESKLEEFNAGVFSIRKPKRWKIITAGACSNFAFLIRDFSEPIRQIFFFGEVGPVYMNRRQKQIDKRYMMMGGYPIKWVEMPVINPFTPKNFISKFYLIAKTRIAKNFMPQSPALENLQIISEIPQQKQINNGRTSLIRAIFTKNRIIGEGLFLVTIAPVMPFTGGPGGGFGYGFSIIGITAPKNEFTQIKDKLIESIRSFTISNAYVNQCLKQQERTYSAILKTGQTLRETSDILMKGWEKRNKIDDIIAEKKSDAILGKERLYDSSTGEVFEFDNGFYDKYKLNPRKYKLNNLKLLPKNNYKLWMKSPLNGYRYID